MKKTCPDRYQQYPRIEINLTVASSQTDNKAVWSRFYLRKYVRKLGMEGMVQCMLRFDWAMTLRALPSSTLLSQCPKLTIQLMPPLAGAKISTDCLEQGR